MGLNAFLSLIYIYVVYEFLYFALIAPKKSAVSICSCRQFGAVPTSMPAVFCERANAVIAGWKQGAGLSRSLFLSRGIG